MILAIKTADKTASLWLYPAAASAKPVAEDTWDSGRALADELLARINSLVTAHAPHLQSLTGIVIFSGPGSFTSLRIGHTVASALADSLSISVAGATGEDWIGTAVKALATTPSGQPALPFYGSEAHVSRPKT